MSKARYICLEGTEGVGKTTQTQNLVDYLKSKGFSVLQTKEPGTPLSPLTMKLRGIMLDKQYDDDLSAPARELISQAIRSIHLEKVIKPAFDQYDFIVQDRGILSGYAYGTACGNDFSTIKSLANYVTNNNTDVYDQVLYLKGDVSAGLDKALNSKQEFEQGDAMEARGKSFMQQVSYNMDKMSEEFNTTVIDVNGKGIEDVFQEIVNALGV